MSPWDLLKHEYDSDELNLNMAKKTMPSVIGVSISLAAFFGFVFGTVFIYDGDESLGAAIYIVAAVASVLLYVGWRKIAQE